MLRTENGIGRNGLLLGGSLVEIFNDSSKVPKPNRTQLPHEEAGDLMLNNMTKFRRQIAEKSSQPGVCMYIYICLHACI